MTTATFIMLRPGRKIVVKPAMRKYLGFTHGKIVALVSSWESMATNGGYYTVEKLDGPEDSRDLTPDVHRSSFVPVSNSYLARTKRKKKL